MGVTCAASGRQPSGFPRRTARARRWRPGGCTCWEPVHDLEQAPVQVAEPAVRPECCHDCAYRTGSPESLGDGRYGLSDPGELEDFAGRAGKTRFFCHQGSRRVVAWRHPTGAVHPVPEDVRYYDSPVYLARWASEALQARPDVRLYLYETWHPLDDPEGWLERIDRDHERYWLSRVLGPALALLPDGTRIFLVPAGQVLAACQITFEPRYHQLPNALLRADGSSATAPSPEVARLMQETADSVIRKLGLSGAAA